MVGTAEVAQIYVDLEVSVNNSFRPLNMTPEEVAEARRLIPIVEKQLYRICRDILLDDPRAVSVQMSLFPYGGVPKEARLFVETVAVPQGAPIFTFLYPPSTPCDVPIQMCLTYENETADWPLIPKGWGGWMTEWPRDDIERLEKVMDYYDSQSEQYIRRS